MALDRCPRCKKILFDFNKTTHQCPPEWQVRDPDWHGDEWVSVFTTGDAEDAALALGQKRWSNDPCDPHKFEINIEVIDDGEIKTFAITAEPEIRFNATETQSE